MNSTLSACSEIINQEFDEFGDKFLQLKHRVRTTPGASMCGIVGAVSARNIVPILIEGLRRLEYRGYDSCGVAVHQGGALRRARSTARVAELSANVAAEGIE